MSDSETPPELQGKREHRVEQRLTQVKRWAAYVEANPPDVWGEQLNTLVDAQLESARSADSTGEVAEKPDCAERESE